MHAVPPQALASIQQEDDQSMIELRRENDTLREQIAALEGSLAARDQLLAELQATLAELRIEVQALRQETPAQSAPNQTPAAPPSAMPENASLPTDPFGAPEALFEFTRSSYEETFSMDAPAFDAMDHPETARRMHMQELARWARKLSRQATGPVEWTIEVVRLDRLDRDSELQFRVVQPGSNLHYSDREFITQVDGSLYRMMSRDSNYTQGHWVLAGRIQVQPNIEPALTERLAFDVPAFVGPYVTFGFDLDVRSLKRVEEQQIEP